MVGELMIKKEEPVVTPEIVEAANAKPETKKETAEAEIARLAREVLSGKHGIGEAREKSLGKQYRAVMDEVLRIRLQG